MPDDETRSPLEEEPPGPQPEQTDAKEDDEQSEEGSGEGADVNEKSADSFPASDPPSW